MKKHRNTLIIFAVAILIIFVIFNSQVAVRAFNQASELFPLQSTDSDNDGLPDNLENQIGTDPNDPDTDFDGLDDGWEYYRGLDPLSYTSSTGEAIEAIEISIIIALAGTTITFMLVYRNKKNAKNNFDIKIVKRYSVLAACLICAFLLFFVRPPTVHGPVDPGPNIQIVNFHNTMEVNFAILKSQYYNPTLRVEASYPLPPNLVAYCAVRVIHQNGTIIATHNLTILPTLQNEYQSWDGVSINLDYGNYTIQLSASFRDYEDNPVEFNGPMKVELVQVWKDGRNEDQVIWDGFKGWMNIGAGVTILFGMIFFTYYGRRSNKAISYRRHPYGY